MKIRIATRNSQLALWQAEEVRRQLLAACDTLNAEAISLVPIKSDGDMNTQAGFAHFGYKGVFTKRIESALLDGRADIAVHSMKDVHSTLPDTLTIAAMLPREDVRDAFISTKAKSLAELPPGSVVGTASVRRQALLLHHRPDLAVTAFRGNVPTRLEKLQRGNVDATFLAVAGLKRLGLDQHITEICSLQQFMPAVAQGAIGIECRRNDAKLRELLERINHVPTFHTVSAERAMLKILDGDCKTPLCGLAEISAQQLRLQGAWLSPDGSTLLRVERTGTIHEAEAIGSDAGAELKRMLGQ